MKFIEVTTNDGKLRFVNTCMIYDVKPLEKGCEIRFPPADESGFSTPIFINVIESYDEVKKMIQGSAR